MKYLREAVGFSQSELARLSNCTVQTIYKTEQYLFPHPPVAVVHALAKELGWPESRIREEYVNGRATKRQENYAEIAALAGLELTAAVAAVGSRQAFCRLLCIAPSALNRVLGKEGGSYEFINTALGSAGATFRF